MCQNDCYETALKGSVCVMGLLLNSTPDLGDKIPNLNQYLLFKATTSFA